MGLAPAQSEPRAEDVNILSVTPSGWPWRRQLLNFWLTRRPRWVTENLVNRRPLVATLGGLEFLHSAGWFRLGSFPPLPATAPEDRRYQWVLFVANFNGGWEPYRDAFLAVLIRGVHTVWGTSIGFPRYPAPGTRYAVERWVGGRLVGSGHYYQAYPGAVIHDVRSALLVNREVRSFLAAQGPGRPERFAAGRAEVEQLLHRLQHHLGDLTPTPRPWPALGPDGTDGIATVVSAAPIAPEHLSELRRELADLPRGRESPFAEVPGTHFARLLVLDPRSAGHHDDRQVSLANSWLVLAADFDAYLPAGWRGDRPPESQLRRYFDSIAAVAPLARIWRHCRTTAPGSLADYLSATVVGRLLQYRACPDASLEEVLTSLAIHDRFRAAVLHRAVATPKDLMTLLHE